MIVETKEFNLFKYNNIYYNNKENIILNKYIKYYNKYKFNIFIYMNISLLELINIIKIEYIKLIDKLIKFKIIVDEHIINKKIIYLILKYFSNKVILYNKKFIKSKKFKNKNIFKKKPPIVTIMGHVNHGKTTLLDYIRSTKLVSQEIGGITQHISFYNIKTKYGAITFFDTPGHEAFKKMRKKGIKNTDIVILVIAIDSGVMSQTIETIKYIKKLNLPLIIVINKIDKINYNINIIKNELAKHEVISEEWGGEIQFVNISAKTGKGINDLIKAILLQSEILELKEKKKKETKGVVIESYFNKGKGPIVTILIQQGVLNFKDLILYNLEYSKIKSIHNSFGKKINYVRPSLPVEIIGFPIIPKIGEKINFIKSENYFKEIIINKSKFIIKKNLINNKFEINDDILNLNENEIFKINIILKSNVLGSCEVIQNELLKLSSKKIKINIINFGVGNISENDLILALNNKAIILAFNIYSNNFIRKIIEFKKIDVRYYSIIYKLIDDIKKEINLFIPNNKKKIIGLANVINVFKFKKNSFIAGCLITYGIIKKHDQINLLRNNKVIYIGKIDSLKRFKENVKEVNNGMEFGIYIKKFNNFKINDKIEIFN
ncbi:MAG: translation initiation factor IF-2 [Enterobacteriaceae bacterium]